MATILVVDDEPDLRFLMRKLLERNGHTVVEASHGGHAMVVLEEDSGIQVVITDLEMPRVDGYELVAHLRKHRPGIPVIVWADSVSPELDADEIFAKPYGGPEIADAVDRLA